MFHANDNWVPPLHVEQTVYFSKTYEGIYTTHTFRNFIWYVLLALVCYEQNTVALQANLNAAY